jgi:hypothetical protein
VVSCLAGHPTGSCQERVPRSAFPVAVRVWRSLAASRAAESSVCAWPARPHAHALRAAAKLSSSAPETDQCAECGSDRGGALLNNPARLDRWSVSVDRVFGADMRTGGNRADRAATMETCNKF